MYRKSYKGFVIGLFAYLALRLGWSAWIDFAVGTVGICVA